MLEGFEPATVDVFGSLCTLIPRNDMPPGLSPDCQNVVFTPGGVASRPGLVSRNSQTAGTTYFTSVAQYVDPTGARHRILLDTSGSVFRETATALTSLSASIGANMQMKACQFGARVFMAFSDGKTAAARARAYGRIGTTDQFDPLSLSDTANVPSITSSVTTHTGVAGGYRNAIEIHETRSGYLAPPGFPGTTGFNLTADKGWDIAGLAKDPFASTNVTRRRVYVTLAAASSAAIIPVFYTHPLLWLNDTTTTVINDAFVTDAMLTGFAATDPSGSVVWGGLRPLPQCVGLASYSNRLVAWGVAHSIPRICPSYMLDNAAGPCGNLSLDGGSAAVTYTNPSGWTPSTGDVTGWTDGVSGSCGAAFKFTVVSGATTMWGSDRTVAWYAQQEPSPSGIYYCRFRAKRSSGLNAGSLEVWATGITPISVSAATLTTDWAWYSGLLFSGNSVALSSTYLNAQLKGSPGPDGAWAAIDDFQIFPAEYPVDDSILYVSEYADPETFLYGKGEISVNENDGQRITNAYELRGVMRVTKNRSLYSVMDTGGTPDNWHVERTSDTVGALGPWAVGMGDGWAILAAYDGLYMDTGGVPQKISQEINATWATLNRAYAHLTRVAVDTDSRRVFVLFPGGSSTTNNTLLVCDYVEGWEDPITTGGHGRKWCPWIYPLGTLNDVSFLMDENGKPQVMFAGGYTGSNGARGNLMSLDQSGAYVYDYLDGTTLGPVNAYYETATVGMPQGRSLFGYIIARASGVGELGASLVHSDGSLLALPGRPLSAAPVHDIEIATQRTGIQFGLRFGTSAKTDAFAVRRVSLFRKPAPFSRVRGHNK